MLLWINPRTGISGDMLLGALLDVGASVDAMREAIGQTGLSGWSLEAQRVQVDAIGAIHAEVSVSDTATERHASELLAMVDKVSDPWVAAVARRAIQEIAVVEAGIHAADPETVHLHEIGGHDTIVDTVGVAAGLRSLGIEQVVCAPVAVGVGMVKTAHGLLPAPAPAAAALLAGATIVGTPITGETVTPTGAALLRAMDATFSPLPAGTMLRTGYGAGTKRFPGIPNVLQASLVRRSGNALPAERMTVLEANLDDVSGEVIAHAAARAMAAGAADAWVTPVMGKKGRPAQVLSVLAHAADVAALEQIVLRETGSLGLRRTTVDRVALPRTASTVATSGGEVRLKSGPSRTKGEFDDIARIAVEQGRSFLDVEREVNGLAGGAGHARGESHEHAHPHEDVHPHPHADPRGVDHGHPHAERHAHPHDHGDGHAHPHARN